MKCFIAINTDRAQPFQDVAQFASGVDVVVDYLWGRSAEILLVAAAKGGEEATANRFVQIGSVGGANITLPSAVLRSSAIEMMGSGIGSVPLDRALVSDRRVAQGHHERRLSDCHDTNTAVGCRTSVETR